MNSDPKSIRTLVSKLSEDELKDFIFDHFYTFRQATSDTTSRKDLIRQLIDFAFSHKEIPKLLDEIKKVNPIAYKEYEKELQVQQSQLDVSSLATTAPQVPTQGPALSSKADNSTATVRGPAFALVVGINTYASIMDQNANKPRKDFPDLRCPRQDAEDFYNFLKSSQSITYDVPPPLLDEKATLTNIKDGLETLRMKCGAQSRNNPLAIVYFSGHGTTDAEGRHYLIPHDGDRTRLRATALLDRDLSGFLDELQEKTNKIVLFLDACHAGGAIERPGAKGAGATYDFEEVLAKDNKRYIIASCSRNQESYEAGQNSIFTEQLLKLLRCEANDFDQEQVELYLLYNALKNNVEMIAQQRKLTQNPVSNLNAPTEIVLAINHQSRIKRKNFLDAIGKELENRQFPDWAILRRKLGLYVSSGTKQDKYQRLYPLFDQHCRNWTLGDKIDSDCCEELIAEYQEAKESSHPPKDSPSQRSIGATDLSDTFSKTSGTKLPPTSPEDTQPKTTILSLRTSRGQDV